ncbi:hypothetical protein ACFY7H_32745 [Streptomyces sp. NPDC012794]|uniref:hypothetical protein n=1 Tax=Streptomyces sp. NPDC012794 TaxID=3364850 RepID=UPI0036C1E401
MGPQQVLGCLWASDAEGAASFVPRDAADLDAYRAGLVWPDRLQVAYDRRLSLENRDRLGAAIEALTPEDRTAAHAAVGTLDARFRGQTVDDAGTALALALGKAQEDFLTAPWYWRRRPPTLPWEARA